VFHNLYKLTKINSGKKDYPNTGTCTLNYVGISEEGVTNFE